MFYVILILGLLASDTFAQTWELSRNEKIGFMGPFNDVVQQSVACGSCYGAISTQYACCNNCADIEAAYKYKGWSYYANTFNCDASSTSASAIPEIVCPMCAAAFACAIQYVNSDSTIMKNGFKFSAVMYDSSSAGRNNKYRALTHATEMMEGNATKPGVVVADLFSSTTRITSMIGEAAGVPMIGYGATSDTLSDKVDFPFFSRVVPPDRFQAPYLASVIHKIGWTNVAILNEDDAYGAGFALAFITRCTALNVTVRSRQTFTGAITASSIDVQLQNIKDSGAMIILMVASSPKTENILKEAKLFDLTGKNGYVWLGTDGWMSTSQLFSGSRKDDMQAANGGIGLFPFVEEATRLPSEKASGVLANCIIAGEYKNLDLESETGSFVGGSAWNKVQNEIDNAVTRREIPSDFSVEVQVTGIDKWAYYVWDATILAAYALSSRSSGSLLEKVRKSGVPTKHSTTGEIKMDANTGDRDGAYEILLVRNNELVQVGTVSGNAETPNITINNDVLIWADGEKGAENRPSDGNFELATKVPAFVVPLAVVMVLLLVIGLMGFFVYRRKKNAKGRKLKGKVVAANAETEKAKAEFAKFKDQVEGIRQAFQPWDGSVGASPRDQTVLDMMASSDGMNDDITESEVIWIVEASVLLGDFSVPTCNSMRPVPDYSMKKLEAAHNSDTVTGSLLGPSLAGTYGPVTDESYWQTNTPVLPQPPSTTATATWYWEEDSGNLHYHDKSKIMAPSWVAYDAAVSAELEPLYWAFKNKQGPPVLKTDLKSKKQKQDSGLKYEIDFQKMKQSNAKTGFSRNIIRFVHDAARENETEAYYAKFYSPSEHKLLRVNKLLAIQAEDGTTTYPARIVKMSNGTTKCDIPSFNFPSQWWSTHSIKCRPSTAKSLIKGVSLPADVLAAEGLPLVLAVDDLVEVSKRRDDGFWFGSILFSKDDNTIGTAGWFPSSAVDKPASKILEEFRASLGGGGTDALQPPKHWSPQAKHSELATTDELDLNQKEARDLLSQFYKTTSEHSVQIVSITRVQNVALWQSYAVKKIQLTNRDTTKGAHTIERTYGFHGSDEDTVPKIIQQGFNRSFCGKNATVYGKGVYFARDSSYSTSNTYSRPNTAGVKHMFMVRVLHGEYCLGRNGMLTPDVKDYQQNRLYDSTVNDMNNPIMWVTYHDAQAYPEYLIRFKKPSKNI